MSTGNTHEQRSMAPNAYLPADDPGKNGGATYMGTSQQPAQEDWENIFGPAGREVVTDPQRNKRHQRWHLPDRLKGPNNFLTDRIDGLITDATSSPFTSVILPYLYVENPDQPLTWNTFSYDEGLASRVPYEAAARVLTQTKSSHSAYIVRQGLAISMEHNFMLSPAGRADFQNQLLQLVGSIQYTNDLDCHIALITAPNYERTEVEKYAYNERDVYQTIKLYTEMYGIAQKNANGLDCVIEEAKQVFRKWGAKEPTFLLTNSRLGFQQNMTLERTQYLTNGIDGVRRLRDGPELSKYRGLSVINTRSFSLGAGRAPRDLLVRRVRVAEHYALPPMTAGELKNACVKLYDEGKDQMVAISGEKLFKKSCLEDTDYGTGGGGLPADCDTAWKTALKLDGYFDTIEPHLWADEFWTCPEVIKYFATGQDYKDWMKLDAAPADNSLRGWYHPKFVATLKLFDPKTTYDMAAALVEGTFPDAMKDEMFKAWLHYMVTYTSTKGGKKASGQIMLCGLKKSGDETTISFKIDAKDIQGYGEITDHTGYEYRFTLPFHAYWTRKVPSTEENYEKLFDRDHPSLPKKYNLFLLRPTIEHSMIGCVVGRGGAEDLGATLWGQTELSCYDDAMHGKWGMSYKFHARSLVYNEKHLLRLWDVAFAGYHGGMGTTIVDDTNRARWKSSCVHLDEALSYSHPDLFVMRFDDDYTADHLPNPVCFHHDYVNGNAAGYAIDPSNIYSVFKDEMMLAKHLTPNDVQRFLEYKKLMPDFSALHKGRKTAGHASHEGDTHQNSFSFQGTMEVWSNGACTCVTRGTGHLGHSCCGSSSIRSGKGMMNPMSIDTSVRVV